MQYKMIDENSAQYKQDIQRLQALRTQVVLWLLVLALGIVLIPLMLITSWVRNDVARLESELLSVQSSLASATTPSQEAVNLTAELANTNQLISTMQTVTLPSGVNWPLVVDAVEQYDPATIELTSLSQIEEKVQLTGRALNNDAVVRYQQNLFVAGAFKDVVVLSMSTLPPVPTPVPSEDENATPVDVPIGNVEFVIDLVIESNAPAVSTPAVNVPAASTPEVTAP
jgi:hypothetical protein